MLANVGLALPVTGSRELRPNSTLFANDEDALVPTWRVGNPNRVDFVVQRTVYFARLLVAR
jgi:hypothetical protein